MNCYHFNVSGNTSLKYLNSPELTVIISLHNKSSTYLVKMSTVMAVSFHVFLILLLSNATVNGSLIRLLCQYPNSELCKMYQRSNLNQHFTVTNHNSNNEFIRTIDEKIENLRDQLEGKVALQSEILKIYFTYNFSIQTHIPN